MFAIVVADVGRRAAGFDYLTSFEGRVFHRCLSMLGYRFICIHFDNVDYIRFSHSNISQAGTGYSMTQEGLQA